jgi:F-type H+-transporting ATPase subunit gamma
MKNYLTYQNDIQGLSDVAATVKTVEKIAASSIHLLKQAVSNLNLYTEETKIILARLSRLHRINTHPLLREPGRGRKVIVVLTGNKGLVGGLWHAVVNRFLENRNRYHAVVTVGVKTRRYLEEERVQPLRSFTPGADIPQPEDSETITRYLFAEFRRAAFSQVDILYPRFVTLAEQYPRLIPFLPFKFRTEDESGRHSSPPEAAGLPIFEPSEAKIFDWLLNKYIGLFFHQVLIETKLSELSARTVAMEQAGAKTERLVKKLTLDYLKERRRYETQKQLESFVVHQIT